MISQLFFFLKYVPKQITLKFQNTRSRGHSEILQKEKVLFTKELRIKQTSDFPYTTLDAQNKGEMPLVCTENYVKQNFISIQTVQSRVRAKYSYSQKFNNSESLMPM